MPTVEQLLKAAPLVGRTSIDLGAPQLSANGDAITPELRDRLLAKCAAGEYVELDVDMLAYEQRAGEMNRNYVRFRDGSMIALGASGAGKPFLRDHEQYDTLARAGTITKSKTEKRSDGDYAIRMTARLTAPWAVELALRGLLSSVSIGWQPTGPVECSIHEAPVGTKCWCWPGDKMAESVVDGVKKYVRDRQGQLTAEWIYTSAVLKECSVCNVPGVPSAGIDGVRAALSAAGIDVDQLDRARVDTLEHIKSTTAAADPNVITPEPSNMNTAPALAAALTFVVLTEAQAAYYAKLSPSEQAAFAAKSIAERDAAVASSLAADPVVYTTKAGIEVRKSSGELALALAKQGDAHVAALEAQSEALKQATQATRTATLRTRAATEIAHLAATEDIKIAVLGALESLDDATKSGALAMLKSADALFASAGKAKGADLTGDPVPDSAEAKVLSLAKQIAKDKGVSLAIAEAMVFDTDEGAALYTEMEQRKNAARTAQFRAH